MPAVDSRTVRVEGLGQLQRAFTRVDKRLGADFRNQLKKVAEPVRRDAERLASTEITRITIPWSRMRTGISRSIVYVAPVERGRASRRNRRLRRPNLADLLMGRAMSPALDRNRGRIVHAAEQFLDEVGADWQR